MNHILRRIVGRERARAKEKGKEKRGSDDGDREAARANLSGIVAVVSVLVMLSATAALATATEPPTPFHVYGWVKYSNGTAVLGPNVSMTNLNTTEDYTVETNASSNYYQVITSSCNVSEGDVLRLNASDGVNSVSYEVTVTSENMTDGGLFEQNLTIQSPQVGICGDCDAFPGVTTNDGWLIIMNVTFPGDPRYALVNLWAADCDGFEGITTNDGWLIIMNVTFPGDPRYALQCAA